MKHPQRKPPLIILHHSLHPSHSTIPPAKLIVLPILMHLRTHSTCLAFSVGTYLHIISRVYIYIVYIYIVYIYIVYIYIVYIYIVYIYTVYIYIVYIYIVYMYILIDHMSRITLLNLHFANNVGHCQARQVASIPLN